MGNSDKDVGYKIKENLGYHSVCMETLKASDAEGFKDGLTEYFIDGVESWWAGIPTAEKKARKIWNVDGTKELKAIDAWKEAEMEYAPAEAELFPSPTLGSVERAKLEYNLGVKKRKLALRKKQIIIDLLYGMGFLLKKYEVSRFSADSDAAKVPWAEEHDG